MEQILLLVDQLLKAGVFEFGNNIKPSSTTANDTGISYSYTIDGGYSNVNDNKVMTINIVQADLMNRWYNPNSGEHFYTKDLNEKDTLVKLGWQYEGIEWIASQKNF